MNLGSPLPSYTAEVLARSSRSAARKLNSAAHSKVSFNHFEDASIDLRSFDWLTGPRNRNWWWQLQHFPFVRWYIQSINIISATDQHDFLVDFIFQSLKQWQLCAAGTHQESPLAWHDHATALRLKNLVDLYVALDGLHFSHQSFMELLSDEIYRHVFYLLKEETYSRRTNHGFEQSDVLLRTSLIFPGCVELKQVRDISRERLIDEISFAFTEQGVHKENSPGYHQLMIFKLKALSVYHELGDDNLARIGNKYLERAKMFLKAITLPDGTLPLIGDTGGGLKADQHNLPDPKTRSATHDRSAYCIWDYAESGYLIIEYKDEQTSKQSKLIVRAGQFSNYHRHDDDLSIYWQIGNQLILGDGGLYSHNENDPKRRFIRSSQAHNTVYVPGLEAERKVCKIPRRAQLQIKSDPNRIIAITYCFSGWKLRRVINFERLTKGSLLVEDQAFSEKCLATIASNWLIPAVDGVHIHPSTQSCRIQLSGDAEITITSLASDSGLASYNGWSGKDEHSAIMSKEFGVVQKATRLSTRWSGPGRHQTRLQFTAQMNTRFSSKTSATFSQLLR